MEKQTNFQVSVNPLGEKMFREVFKREVFDKEHPPPLTGVREFTVNHLFANVWSRSADDFGPNPKITLRERRLISIALLAAQGFSDQLKEHVTGAFHAEIDERELLDHWHGQAFELLPT